MAERLSINEMPNIFLQVISWRWADAFRPHLAVEGAGADAAVAPVDVRRHPARLRGPEVTFGAVVRLEILKSFPSNVESKSGQFLTSNRL